MALVHEVHEVHRILITYKGNVSSEQAESFIRAERDFPVMKVRETLSESRTFVTGNFFLTSAMRHPVF